MAEERIFNIFIYFYDGVARVYGMRHHRISGGDEEKLLYLRGAIDGDHPLATRFALPRSFTPEQWRAAHRHGKIIEYFEEAFQIYRAREQPLFCVTAIVDGEARIDTMTGPEPFRGDQVSVQEGRGAVPDYLVDYVEGTNFRFTDLIHDDYFLAIRTLFNARLYVSCAKLLMSCIDTLAFVEFGDVNGNFARWLDAYVDLTSHDISSDELWEFRHSVMHMTNLASRKIVSGKVSPIMPYVGGPATLPILTEGNPKPFNLHGLIVNIGDGIGRWAETYNEDHDKFLSFIERYDLTISDSRMAQFTFAEATNVQK